MQDRQENWIDRQIREATERGEFDNLPGAGKPLNLRNTDDPDWWVKGLIEREQLDMTAALPPALALRKEVETLPQRLAEERSEQNVRELITDLNQRIVKARLRPGDSPVWVRTVNVERAVAEWRESTGRRPPADD